MEYKKEKERKKEEEKKRGEVEREINENEPFRGVNYPRTWGIRLLNSLTDTSIGLHEGAKCEKDVYSGTTQTL